VFAVVELKAELNACLVSEVALIVVSMSESIAKASKQIIKFNRADRNLWGHRNIEASANNEIEGIVARRFTGH